MKHCNICGTGKPTDHFHKRSASKDGLAARCKSCQAAYDNERLHDPKRVQQRKEIAHRYADKKSEYNRRHHGKHPLRRAARVAVGNAIKAGTLIVKPCEVCGFAVGVHAHHEDYTRPLDVRWLCRMHHAERHVEINRERLRSAA